MFPPADVPEWFVLDRKFLFGADVSGKVGNLQHYSLAIPCDGGGQRQALFVFLLRAKHSVGKISSPCITVCIYNLKMLSISESLLVC